MIAAQPSVTGTGVFQVWADGRDLSVWTGNFGIANDSRCQQQSLTRAWFSPRGEEFVTLDTCRGAARLGNNLR